MRLQMLLKTMVVAGILSLLATLALGAGSKALSGGAYKLVYKMKKGQRLKYKTTLDVQNSMEMQGNEMTSSSNATSELHIDVEEVGKDGNLTYVYALDSLKITAQGGPQGNESYQNPEGMIGKRTRQTISALGRKIKSVAVDSMIFPGSLAQRGGRQTAFHFIELTAKEVKIGDSWSTSTPDTAKQMGGQIIITPELTYTVVGEVDTMGYKCLRIAYNGKTALNGNGLNMGMNFSIEGEGPTSGTAYFAPKEGLLVAVIGNSDLETTVALTGQMTMTIPQSTASKMTVVLMK
jgi:hypothetical protein